MKNMNRIKMMGLCLVAALALSVVAVSTASAEPPEWGRCLKVKVKKSGTWGNTGCTTTSGLKDKEFEWYPRGPGPPLEKVGLTMTLKPKTKLTLQTVKGDKVVCTGGFGAGEIDTVNHGHIDANGMTFTGCSSQGFTCQTAGQAGGTIVSSPPTPGGQFFGWLSKEAKTVTMLFSAGTNWFDFDCTGGNLLKVKLSWGALSQPVQTGKMLLKATVKYKATKGVQEPIEANCCSEWFFEVNIYNGAEELIEKDVQTGLTAAFVLQYEEKWEVNPVA